MIQALPRMLTTVLTTGAENPDVWSAVQREANLPVATAERETDEPADLPVVHTEAETLRCPRTQRRRRRPEPRRASKRRRRRRDPGAPTTSCHDCGKSESGRGTTTNSATTTSPAATTPTRPRSRLIHDLEALGYHVELTAIA